MLWGVEMSVWSLGKAEVLLSEWNIIEVKVPGGRGELFIGYSVNEGVGRLSTRIEHFDPESKTGRTISGSTYTFIGEPGMPHDDAIYVLETKLGAERVDKELFSNEASGDLKFKYPV